MAFKFEIPVSKNIYAAAKYATRMHEIIKSENDVSHKSIQNEPGSLKILRFGTQAICLESIVPQNVLEQHKLLPGNGEIIVILTKNNSIFPPNTCIDPVKSE